jgi:hypothetical protein
MNGFLKFALGVAVLGAVGLVGLFVMITVTTFVFGQTSPPRRTFELDQAQAELEYAESLAIATDDRGQPAQVQVNLHDSWIDAASPFVGIILLFGTPAIIFIVIRFMRRGRVAAPSDESALVHELARRAQDLSQRMEALETILLDRTRTAR